MRCSRIFATAAVSAGSAASTVAASETATAQSDATTIESSAAAAKVQVAGPLGEAELEAQKVANELYPDAQN